MDLYHSSVLPSGKPAALVDMSEVTMAPLVVVDVKVVLTETSADAIKPSSSTTQLSLLVRFILN